MKIIHSPQKMRQIAARLKINGKTIGLVPTMGALHDGHLSLVKKARTQNKVVIVSIFVNPVQFGPKEDYLRYPRPFAKDSALCRKAGVNYIFAPKPEQMYPGHYSTYVNVGRISDILCGSFRPGHFRGVATVVAKLFNITAPDRAYFGQKDYQQVRVLKRMADDLNFDVKIVQCPIIREPDGLAKSSRNSYLSPEERRSSAEISKALQHAAYLVECDKSKNSRKIIEKVKEKILKIPRAKIDYIEIRDAETLEKADPIEKSAVILCAVWVGKTRLIDNLIIRR